jgi:hypothetical protein
VVIRRALALLAVGTLLACNAIIGLGEPSVNEGTDAAQLGDVEQADAAPGSDAPETDTANERGDGTSRPDNFVPQVDASDANDSTVDDVTNEGGPGGSDATGGTGPALVYVINATQLPGIEICLGMGPSGGTTTVGTVLPYPQHQLQPGPCVPLTCADQNVHCGPAPDGCGGLLQCGTCPSPQTCGGSGVGGQCGLPGEGGTCVPQTCTQQNVQCGTAGDGCGSLLSCGNCPAGQTCIAGHCGVPPSTGGLLTGTGQAGPSMNAYTGAYVTAFIIPTPNVPPNVDCSVLLGTDGQGGTLQAGTFYRAGTVPPGTFALGKTTLVAFWGCPPGLADGGACGMAYNPDAGNLAAAVFSELSAAMLGPNAIEVFPVHASPALDCVMPGCPMGISQLVLDWPGGSAPFPLLLGMPGMQAMMVGFEQDASSAAVNNGPYMWQASFDDIARASNDGSATMATGGPYFAGGQSYFLVTVGNPFVSPDASTGAAFHLIGAPLSFPPDPNP